MLTFSDIPKSSRIFAKTAARLKPECAYKLSSKFVRTRNNASALTRATSTTSKIMHRGTPSRSRWTDTATNDLWFSEVHASVAKFRFPSYSYWSVSMTFLDDL
jgi:hypothetical protein